MNLSRTALETLGIALSGLGALAVQEACSATDPVLAVRAPPPPPPPRPGQLAVSVSRDPVPPGKALIWFAVVRYSPAGPPPTVGPGEARAWMRIGSSPGEAETVTPFVEASYSTQGPVLNFGLSGSQKTNFVVFLEVPHHSGFAEFAVQEPGQARRVIAVPMRIGNVADEGGPGKGRK